MVAINIKDLNVKRPMFIDTNLFYSHQSSPIKENMPTKEELWEQAQQLTSLRYNQIDLLASRILDRQIIEKKVIDLFLTKLKEIMFSYNNSDYKTNKIITKLVNKYEYDILIFLDIIYEKDYLKTKLGVSFAPIYNSYNHLFLDDFLSLKRINLDINSTIGPFDFSEYEIKNEFLEVISNNQLYSKIGSFEIESEALKVVFESITEVIGKDFLKYLGILFRREYPKDIKSFCSEEVQNLSLKSSIISCMYYRTSLVV